MLPEPRGLRASSGRSQPDVTRHDLGDLVDRGSRTEDHDGVGHALGDDDKLLVLVQCQPASTMASSHDRMRRAVENGSAEREAAQNLGLPLHASCSFFCQAVMRTTGVTGGPPRPSLASRIVRRPSRPTTHASPLPGKSGYADPSAIMPKMMCIWAPSRTAKVAIRDGYSSRNKRNEGLESHNVDCGDKRTPIQRAACKGNTRVRGKDF
jgi:hypothetical protein